MKSALRRSLLVAIAIVPASTLRCVPADYLGVDPTASPVAPAPEAAAPAPPTPTVDAAPACQPPEGRLPYVSAAPRDPVCTTTEVGALANCLADAEEGPVVEPLSRCLEGGRLTDACRRCLVTPADAPLWGPLVVYEKGIVRPNVGGCVERTVSGGIACSAPAGALEQCVHVRGCACSDQAVCRVEASNGVCAAELAAVEACQVDLFRRAGAREAYQLCVPKADASYWRRQLSTFCGP